MAGEDGHRQTSPAARRSKRQGDVEAADKARDAVDVAQTDLRPPPPGRRKYCSPDPRGAVGASTSPHPDAFSGREAVQQQGDDGPNGDIDDDAIRLVDLPGLKRQEAPACPFAVEPDDSASWNGGVNPRWAIGCGPPGIASAHALARRPGFPDRIVEPSRPGLPKSVTGCQHFSLDRAYMGRIQTWRAHHDDQYRAGGSCWRVFLGRAGIAAPQGRDYLHPRRLLG